MSFFDTSALSRYLNWRLLLPAFCLAILSVSVFGAPDPDLFDGRVTASTAATTGEPTPSGAESESMQPSETSAQSADLEGKERDLDSIGQSSVGDTVEVTSSKQGSGSGTEQNPSEESASSGSGSSASGSEPAAEIAEPRDFDQFGFGGAAGEEIETVDVNRSKVPAGSGGEPSNKPPSATPPQSGGVGTGGAEPQAPRRTGDYGTNVPAGL